MLDGGISHFYFGKSNKVKKMRKIIFFILMVISFPSFTQNADSLSSKHHWGISVGIGYVNQNIRVNRLNYPSQNPFFSFGLNYTRYISPKWEFSAEAINNIGSIKNQFQDNNTSYIYESDFLAMNIPLNFRYNFSKIKKSYFLPHFIQVGPSINIIPQNIEKLEVNNVEVRLLKKLAFEPEYLIKLGTGYVLKLSELLIRTEFNYYLPIKFTNPESNLVANLYSSNNSAFSFNLIIENRLTKAQKKRNKKKSK
jgi:hypothetical protein